MEARTIRQAPDTICEAETGWGWRLSVRLSQPASGQDWLRAANRRLETAATCFDCCLSQEILDGGNGLLTTKVLGFDFGETIDPVAELVFPELVEFFAMPLP
jgi:hypothetical protein